MEKITIVIILTVILLIIGIIISIYFLSSSTDISYETKWNCLDGFGVPMRLNKNGDVECASVDGVNCLWSEKCNMSTLPAKLNPLSCGAGHKSAHGESGYNNPVHWCNKVFKTLKSKNTPIPVDLAM